MTTITTRSGKGSPLTNDEVDANFTGLNSDKVETSGDSMTGNLSFGDNNKVILGTSSDFQLYHDGTDSLIKDKGQGDLRLTSNGSGIIFLNDNETESLANFQLNGAVTLYYDNAAKIATTSTGIDVTGSISADDITLSDSSTPTLTLTDTTNTVTNIIKSDNSVGTVGTSTTHDLYIQSNNIVRQRVRSNGDIAWYNDSASSQDLYWDASTSRLGLGITSPSATLTVGSPIAAAIDFVSNGVASLAGGIAFDAGSGNDIQLINYRTSNMQFGNGGSADLTIDSSGNVGIGGAPSSGYKLDVMNAGATNWRLRATNNSTVSQFFYSNGTTATQNIYFGDSGNTAAAGIRYLHSNDSMLFAGKGNGTTMATFDSSGNFGIGTTSPNVHGWTKALSVDGGTSSSSAVELNQNGTKVGALSLQGDQRLQVVNHTSNPITFHTNGIANERMRIDSSGNAIFTKAGGAYLQLKDASAVRGAINVETSDGLVFTTGASFTERMRLNSSGMDVSNGHIKLSAGYSLQWDDSHERIEQSNGALEFFTNNSQQMTISGGNVGIGTSSPSNGKLTLEGVDGASSAGIYFNNTTATNGKSYSLSSGNSGEFMLYDRTSSAYRLFVNSSGDLLVGTTTGSGTTGTYSGFGAYAGGNIFSSSTGRSIFARRSSDGSIIDLRRDGTTVGSIGCNNNDPYIARAGGNGFRWYSGAVVPTNDSGATADNAMDLGSSIGRFKDLHLSGTARASTYRLQSGSTTTGGLFHEKDITGSGSSVDTSVYAETGNAIHFMVNGSATAVGTFDTSGNFGIGTSNPANNGLHIEKSGTARLRLAQAGVRSWDMEATGGDWRLNNATNSSEAFRVDSSGRMQVGKTGTQYTTPGVQLGTYNSNSVNDATQFCYDVSGGTNMYCTAPTSGAQISFYRQDTGAFMGQIVNGASNTVSYATSSDQRLKENIADADDAGSKVDAIQVRKFDWKADGSHQDYGMIAQELQTVAPEAVSTPENSDDMMGVDYSKLVPMLVKEIQSLRARVAQLEND